MVTTIAAVSSVMTHTHHPSLVAAIFFASVIANTIVSCVDDIQNSVRVVAYAQGYSRSERADWKKTVKP